METIWNRGAVTVVRRGPPKFDREMEDHFYFGESTMGQMQVFPSYVLSRQTELPVAARPTAPDCGAKDIIKVTAPATD